jgi:hypothetical protein
MLRQQPSISQPFQKVSDSNRRSRVVMLGGKRSWVPFTSIKMKSSNPFLNQDALYNARATQLRYLGICRYAVTIRDHADQEILGRRFRVVGAIQLGAVLTSRTTISRLNRDKVVRWATARRVCRSSHTSFGAKPSPPRKSQGRSGASPYHRMSRSSSLPSSGASAPQATRRSPTGSAAHRQI